jgi:hypothetical protein
MNGMTHRTRPGRRQPAKLVVDIATLDGKRKHSDGTFKPHGTPSRAVESADVDIVSMRMPGRRVLVMGAGMAGRPANTRVYFVADDGRHMTASVVGHGPDGTPTTQANTWIKR